VPVALGVEHEKRVRHILLSFVASPTVQYFTHYLINSASVGGKKLLNIKSVMLSTLSETFLILRRFELEILPKMYIGLHVKYPLFLPEFTES
jgi:hypothetical protein